MVLATPGESGWLRNFHLIKKVSRFWRIFWRMSVGLSGPALPASPLLNYGLCSECLSRGDKPGGIYHIGSSGDHSSCNVLILNIGIARRMKASNNGTVNAISPCELWREQLRENGIGMYTG